MQPVEEVGVISKPNVTRARAVLPELMDWLRERGIRARWDRETAEYLGRGPGLPREAVPEGTQLVIVLGGDGTLLAAARAIAGREIPLFAVNLGGLGFLTAITVEELYPELERALRGEHRIARRHMLKCDLVRDDKTIAEYDALNDVVITKAALARMIDLETRVDTQFVCTFKADGLIVSTPTGSTAYSLSAGGPIMFPSVNALCITPICPHMLAYRPVLVPESSVIRIVVQAESEAAYLTIDGQTGQPLMRNDRIVCRSSPRALFLIRPPKAMFFDVLRAKLKWGER
jgi:NAD+ kinase